MVHLVIIKHGEAFWEFLIRYLTHCWNVNKWPHLGQLSIPDPNGYGHGSIEIIEINI